MSNEKLKDETKGNLINKIVLNKKISKKVLSRNSYEILNALYGIFETKSFPLDAYINLKFYYSKDTDNFKQVALCIIHKIIQNNYLKLTGKIKYSSNIEKLCMEEGLTGYDEKSKLEHAKYLVLYSDNPQEILDLDYILDNLDWDNILEEPEYFLRIKRINNEYINSLCTSAKYHIMMNEFIEAEEILVDLLKNGNKTIKVYLSLHDLFAKTNNENWRNVALNVLHLLIQDRYLKLLGKRKSDAFDKVMFTKYLKEFNGDELEKAKYLVLYSEYKQDLLNVDYVLDNIDWDNILEEPKYFNFTI